MIADLKPYPEYRESEGKWLGEVPAHWAVRRFKYILREKDSRSTGGKEQLLRVSQFTGVTQRLSISGLDEPDTRAASLVGYKCVNPDDLVINIMLAWNGSLGVSRYDGIASPAYCIYRFGDVARPWYYHHLLRSPAYKARIKALSTGIVESRLRLYTDDLFRLEAILPPPDEQAAIVRFLNHTSQRIERTIWAKRKVIALLNEQKQVIIHRAVTRGLDPNARLKPSGIPWLGEIPEHWDEISVGAATNLIQTGPFGSQLHSHEYISGGIPVINPSHMKDGRIVPDYSISISPTKIKELERHKIKSGDIIAARRGELGRCAVVTKAEVGWICGTGSLLIRCKPMMFTPGFFQMVFSSQGIRDSLSLASIGATMDNLNSGMVARLRMPLPSISEQNQIIEFVRNENQRHEIITSAILSEIDLLREYRTRLIADVVTGKLDVREAAAQLPDEVDEIEEVILDDDDVTGEEVADVE
jgi:type I restriction enzyme S subunit